MDYNDRYNMMNGWNGNINGPGDNSSSLLFMFLMMLVMVVLVVLLVRYLSRTSRAVTGSEDALQLLKKRYAKGEIDKKQFDDIKKDITTK